MKSNDKPSLGEIGHESGVHPPVDRHLVVVIVDKERKRVETGPYRVSVFKHLVGVPAEKELDQVIGGVIKPLDDNATIIIAGNEVFISHERTGAAS